MSITLALILVTALLLSAAIGFAPRWAALRRARLLRQPFPAAWRSLLRRHVPVYRRLPPVLQARLREHVRVFLAEVAFIGCAGLVVDDQIRVTIAAHAALLRLNHAGPPFAGVRQVLVYPGAFAVERVQAAPGGVLQQRRLALSGESWSQGQVILSWADVRADVTAPDAGHNVVLHEFAHQLDQANGAANGAPALGSAAARARWAAVLSREFEALRMRIGQRQAAQQGPGAAPGGPASSAPAPELISDYGASDAAEFFAVATEVFYGQPDALAQRHPALFEVLHAFYGVDPRAWT